MRIILFYHSLVSDWNHGNAHFLRGIMRELQARGHQVLAYEPIDGWSLSQLRQDQGEAPIVRMQAAYPELEGHFYDPARLDLDAVLEDAELVLVHEWNPPELIARIGEHRARHANYRLLFHDTHHRAVSEPQAMARYDLRHYDGVLVFGEVLREIYRQRGWAQQVWTWHEAADTSLFKPQPQLERTHDLVWIGNWGDEERSAELHEFLIEPAAALKLSGTVHGVRYPPTALTALQRAGLAYRGWLPNFEAPTVFARHRCTVHVPRRYYRTMLPGIPTIRVFEALACGIPLVCAPWDDAEGLFQPGADYLIARDGAQMREHLRTLRADADFAQALAAHGLATLRARHTCAHRVDELLAIVASLNPIQEKEDA